MPEDGGKRRRVVLLLGIPGVGKTTLLQEAYNIVRKSGQAVSMVTYSDIMLKRAQADRLASHRDEMRRLPSDIQLRLQKEAAEEIANLGEDRIVMVDTHALIRIGKGAFLPGVPSWVADTLKPTQVVHIEASPEEIANRRSRDTSNRKRDREDIEEIRLHLNLSRFASLVISAQTGAYLRIINNTEGGLASAAKELSQALVS
jgi:adenylate kinase